MQAKGALMQLLLQRETTFRTPPGVPAAFKMPFTRYGVGRDPRKQRDPSINASPLADKSGQGDAVVEGAITSILDLRSVGHWLALALGVPTSHKAVTRQPTNITGVTLHYAQAATPAGNGTLAFAAAGTTLTWTANGETAGAPVNVGAGGRFTIPSGTANHGLVVEVAAGALPAQDKSDANIAVSATLKAHVFPFDLADRPSALLELGHTDTGKYYRTVGAKVNTLAYDLTALEQNIELGILAGAETEQAAAFDAAPTGYNGVRAAGAGGSIGNGADASLGTLVEGKVSLSNNMTGYPVVDGLEGYGLIDQGEIALGGSLKAVFDSAGAYALARAGTSTRLRLGSQATVGADTFALWWDIPNAEFIEKAIPKEGKSGLFAELEWAAHRVAAGTLPLCVLINDVAGY